MLHTPIYDVRGMPYCGPTAIAAVTGEPVSIIRDIIRAQVGPKRNGHARAVMSVSNKIMLTTMNTLGWHVISCYIRQDTKLLRLGDFLDGIQMNEQKGPYIVMVTGHYYAVDQDEVCDTFTRIPLEVHRFKRGRARWVKRWWQFQKS